RRKPDMRSPPARTPPRDLGREYPRMGRLVRPQVKSDPAFSDSPVLVSTTHRIVTLLHVSLTGSAGRQREGAPGPDVRLEASTEGRPLYHPACRGDRSRRTVIPRTGK